MRSLKLLATLGCAAGLLLSSQSFAQTTQPVQINDLIYGLSRGNAAETTQHVRGNPVPVNGGGKVHGELANAPAGTDVDLYFYTRVQRGDRPVVRFVAYLLVRVNRAASRPGQVFRGTVVSSTSSSLVMVSRVTAAACASFTKSPVGTDSFVSRNDRTSASGRGLSCADAFAAAVSSATAIRHPRRRIACMQCLPPDARSQDRTIDLHVAFDRHLSPIFQAATAHDELSRRVGPDSAAADDEGQRRAIALKV